MGKVLSVILALTGLGVGAAAGILLRPAPDPETDRETVVPPPAITDFVKLNNQFVVPVLENGRVAALVILSLSLEVIPGGSEVVFAREPRIRDALLQVLFDHANAGGFRGIFTDGANLVLLRRAMQEAAQRVMGPMVLDVLISDIVRQDA